MDSGTMAQWAAVGISLVSFIMAIIAARATRHKEEIATITTLLATATERLTRVENDLQHMPDKDRFHRMEIQLTELSGQLKVMDANLKPVSAIASRLQDVLMEGGKS